MRAGLCQLCYMRAAGTSAARLHEPASAKRFAKAGAAGQPARAAEAAPRAPPPARQFCRWLPCTRFSCSERCSQRACCPSLVLPPTGADGVAGEGPQPCGLGAGGQGADAGAAGASKRFLGTACLLACVHALHACLLSMLVPQYRACPLLRLRTRFAGRRQAHGSAPPDSSGLPDSSPPSLAAAPCCRTSASNTHPRAPRGTRGVCLSHSSSRAQRRRQQQLCPRRPHRQQRLWRRPSRVQGARRRRPRRRHQAAPAASSTSSRQQQVGGRVGG